MASRSPLFRKVMWVLAAGEFLLLVDVALAHYDSGLLILWQWLPLAVLPVVLLVTLLALFAPGPALRPALRVVSVAAVLLGLAGFALHGNAGLFDALRDGEPFTVWVSALRVPPVLAPLSIVGLGVLAWLLAAHWDES